MIKVYCDDSYRASELEYTVKRFAGGEMHVQFDCSRAPTRRMSIHADLRSSDDVMMLLLITDVLRRCNVDDITLLMPYLPYARQDRVCQPGESLSLKVFCNLINSQGYDKVVIWDCHSDVGVALLNNCVNVTAQQLLGPYVGVDGKVSPNTVLVAPDAGAIKKVAEASKAWKLPFVRADKTRDLTTLEITGTVVYSEHVGDKNFLICDDILDGGRTFMELEKVLRPLTTGEVNLYITHGIFSYGTEAIAKAFDRVFVANSFVEDLPSNFTKLFN